MKMPGNCPICNGVMLNKWQDFSSKLSRLYKICNKKANHNVHFTFLTTDHNEVDIISITCDFGKTAIWFITSKQFLLRGGSKSDLRLPFFEPDFASYPRLMNKIQTYVMFS